jgi:hypothetical protein
MLTRADQLQAALDRPWGFALSSGSYRVAQLDGINSSMSF